MVLGEAAASRRRGRDVAQVQPAEGIGVAGSRGASNVASSGSWLPASMATPPRREEMYQTIGELSPF